MSTIRTTPNRNDTIFLLFVCFLSISIVVIKFQVFSEVQLFQIYWLSLGIMGTRKNQKSP